MARNYKLEYERYQGKPEQIKARDARNKARRDAMKKGLVKKGDGMDVDHTVPISKGGALTDANTRVVPEGENRSFSRTKTGALKSQISARERKK